jgi:trichothecene 3-O-acetyltransferase
MNLTDPDQEIGTEQEGNMTSMPNGTSPATHESPPQPSAFPPPDLRNGIPNHTQSSPALSDVEPARQDSVNGTSYLSTTGTITTNGGGLHLNGSVTPPDSVGEPQYSQMNGATSPFGQAASDHVIRLSGIEQCMPRSYIRVCLAYRLPNKEMLPEVEARLNDFVRRTVDAKPYLTGSVVAVDNPGNRVGAVEIRFSDKDFLEYPRVTVKEFDPEEIGNLSYDELCKKFLPPSHIRPEIVSVLKESADEDWAPVFRIQANVIEGGIIISVYLHHCTSDGTGAALLMSGSLLHDEFKFDRFLDGGDHNTPTLSQRLEAFADHKSHLRNELSYLSFNQINDRDLQWKEVPVPGHVEQAVPRAIGRGCVFAFPLVKLGILKKRLQAQMPPDHFITQNTVLMTLIWHSMTRARIPSLQGTCVTTSRLNIPIDIRKKLNRPLPESYFGAAVDFASAHMSLGHLHDQTDATMAQTALAIRRAIQSVDEPYIRQAIALAMKSSPTIDVRDLQGSNMDRTNGADMYITSWEKLKFYEATFNMGLGPPDWVRKPWSRDPGSCIVLPFDNRKEYLEVVIQMTVPDMERLLADEAFMEYVGRWIE